jgi:hypothetical protein
MDYFFIWKNGIDESIDKISTLTLKISEFFENYELSDSIITKFFIHAIDSSNSLILLEIVYEKMTLSTENKIEVNPVWLDFFYKLIEVTAIDFFIYLENEFAIMKLKNFNKKVLEELMDKTFSHLIMNEVKIIDSGEGNRMDNNKCYDRKFIRLIQYDGLIKFLMQTRKVDNIYDLLINEYLRISSAEYTNELANIPHPTFQIEIPVDINNYYYEYSVDLGLNKQIVFAIYYKKSDDSFTVNFKLNDLKAATAEKNSNITELGKSQASLKNILNQNLKNTEDSSFFEIFTFLSVASINTIEGKLIKRQVNVKSITSNKSVHTIFKYNNFKQFLNKVFYNRSVSHLHNQTEARKYLENSSDYTNQSNNSNIGNNYMFNQNVNTWGYDYDSSINYMKHKGNGKVENRIKDNNSHSSNNFDNFNNINISTDVNQKFILSINIKLCFVHSALASYLLRKFPENFDNPKINKISKQLLQILLKHKNLKKDKEDQIVIALLNWRKYIFYFND